MKNWDLIKKANRNYKGNIKRNKRATKALTLGLIIIAVLLQINSGANKAFNEIRGYDSSKYINVSTKYVGGYPGIMSIGPIATIDNEDIEKIKSKYRDLGCKVQLIGYERTGIDFQKAYTAAGLFIVEYESFKTENLNLVSGTNIKDTNGILVSERVQNSFKKLDSDGLPKGEFIKKNLVGEEIVLSIKNGEKDMTASLRVDGVVKNDSGAFNVAKSVMENDRRVGDDVVYMTKEKYDELIAKFNKTDKTNFSVNLIVDANEQGDKIIKELKKDGYTSYGSLSDISDYTFFKDFFNVIFLSLSFLVVLAAVICVVNTIYLSMNERRKEIAIMKSLGLNLKDIKKLFLFEGAILGIRAGIKTLVISTILIWIAKLFFTLYYRPLYVLGIADFDFRVLALLFVLAIVIAVLSTIPAIKKALKINVLSALKE